MVRKCLVETRYRSKPRWLKVLPTGMRFDSSLVTNFKLNIMSKITKEIVLFDSTAIEYATYKQKTLRLTLMWANGSYYEYTEVDPHVWEGLRNSSSPGAFVNEFIKKHNYKKLH